MTVAVTALISEYMNRVDFVKFPRTWKVLDSLTDFWSGVLNVENAGKDKRVCTKH